VHHYPYTYGENWGQWEDARDRARAIVTRFKEKHGIPGIAVAVMVEGELVMAEGFGYAGIIHKDFRFHQY
jgi:CubicO group peptidase (beta-lactamase class C family)